MTDSQDQASTWGWARTGPVWGAQVFPPRGGQDHLGLGSVSSDRILPKLSPGINVLTIHPRYWSFYAFVLDEFWARELPRTKAAFRDFYRPWEALFAFACQVCEAPEHGTITGNIVGSRRTAGPAVADDEFDPRFDYIKEPLGGYGLYYASVMQEAGLLTRRDPAVGFAFDALTPSGRGLADAYREAVRHTRLYADGLPLGEAPVSRQTLVEFAAAGCLCQLRAEAADLPLLQDMFLHAGDPQAAAQRRATLRFLLDACRTAQAEKMSGNGDLFRQLIYFRVVDGDRYTPLDATAAFARRWRLYQAREYFAFAFNRLWAWLVRRGLDVSDDGLIAVPLDEIWQMINEELDGNEVAIQLGISGSNPNAATLGQELGEWLTQHVDVTPGVDELWPRHDQLDEHALYSWCNNMEDDAETLVAMLALLLLLYYRVGRPGRLADLTADRDILSEGEGQRLGMAGFFGQFHRRLLAGDTVSGLLRWIMADCVIEQHERVATAKLPEDTFRLRRMGEAVRFFAKDAPVAFNDSRFLALSTVAHELDLVSSLARPDRRLTATGRAFVELGDLPAGALERAAAPYQQQEEP
ncbi:hypothetical protein ABZ328_22100 [Micromonospora aurantiaca]|uniref:hypothetical protein n=1 Tax=Micromonospora aurantiaca (nom. illeg.) TaxID=47850 RepID=UPI0033E198B0